ncbi:MAG: hypothetical protein LBT00_02120 [Spirochaetaceae bacterium]|nr:hypothetical protein [Spirochaetaceae bacterium]
MSLRVAKGEASQTEKALAPDCFARQFAAHLPLARNDEGLARNDGRARNKV